MADFPLKNDLTYQFPIVYKNAGGGSVAAPAGDVASVTSSSPSIAMSISTLAAALGPYPVGTPTLNCRPMVVESDAGNNGGGIMAELTDTAGLTIDHAMPTFSVVVDVVAQTMGIDDTQMVTTSQPTPTNPGP